MEQPSRCKFRGPPSTVNLQREEDRRGPADGGWYLRGL